MPLTLSDQRLMAIEGLTDSDPPRKDGEWTISDQRLMAIEGLTAALSLT